jgi:hypothetical protein
MDRATKEAEHSLNLADMRLAVEALVSNRGGIKARLQAAAPHFGKVHRRMEGDPTMRGTPANHLRVRIGAALVEGCSDDDDGDEEGDEATVAESIASLDDDRATGIAGDMLRLYEVIGGIRSDDGYKLPSRIATP